MNQSSPASTFLVEAEGLLEQIEETALSVHPGDSAGEEINRLFRAFHTIKGSGAMFGFDTVATFTHHVETVLDKVRDGVLPVSEALLNLILASKDQIKSLLDASQGGPAVAAGNGEKIIASLNALMPGASGQPAAVNTATVPSVTDVQQAQKFHIRFRPNPGLMASGTNPAMLLDELRALGACTLKADVDAVPALDSLQADQCYLAWDMELVTDRGLNAIQDVFIFVEGDSEILIEPLVQTDIPTNQNHRDAATSALPEASPAAAASFTAPPHPVAAESKPSPEEPRASAARKPSAKDSTVRVPSERLDRLVALVGEMVMNQSRLAQLAASVDHPAINATAEELERLVSELRDNILGIRMMPIGTTFSRYKRLVHDLSAELGKEIDLVTEGAETELDKTVLDQIGDPLVHLIRNSIDHGIEPMDIRESSGKPRHGTIRLAASHIGSNVVITIQDDGRGLDPEMLRAKAIEKKLIASDAKLSREELFNLIFLPGFSTAQKVTSVSGRGVGMDVVRRQIEALRGSIQLGSELGKGTSISLTLPLTLAIIDGLLVEIGADQFIIPMSAVTENMELARAERSRNNGRNLVTIRGEPIPYIRLRDCFAISGENQDIEKVVIVQHNHERVGLVVDRVLGSHQTVIQSLGRFYRQIEVTSGATIMGDGRVALILDLAGIIRCFSGQSGQDEKISAVAKSAVATQSIQPTPSV